FEVLIGGTPLVRIAGPGPATVWAKCEHLNPSGSIKDRVAGKALDALGLPPGARVVVASRGSSAAALAIAARMRGLKLVVALPRSMALEKRSLVRALGA